MKHVDIAPYFESKLKARRLRQVLVLTSDGHKLFRPPGTVVPGGLMFCCGFFSFFLCGSLRRYVSEMARAIALKLSHMIGSVGT